MGLSVILKKHRLRVASFSEIEEAVRNAIEKDFPKTGNERFWKGTVAMIKGWICKGLIGNNFIVEEIRGAKFSYKSSDNMSFSAKVKVSIEPNYGRAVEKSYKWKLTGNKYRGKIGD